MGAFTNTFGIGAGQGAGVNQALEWFNTYILRVATDSGTIKSAVNTMSIFSHLRNNGTYNNTLLLWSGEGGTKIRTGTIYNYLTKGYDFSPINNDLTNTTEAYQPFLSGNIAPNEKLSLKNVNKGAKYATHPTISFAANEAWSVTIVLNWNGQIETNGLFGNTNNVLRLSYIPAGLFQYKLVAANETGASFGNTANLVGRTTVITLVAYGTGAFDLFENGILKHSINQGTAMGLETLMLAKAGRTNGSVYYYRIQSSVLTPAKVLSETTYLRTLYPEIETVTIDTQEWSSSNLDIAATIMGNIMSEVAGAANVVKLINPTFTSNANDWTLGTGIAYGTNNIVATAATATATQTLTLIVGAWYKTTIVIDTLTGGSANVLLGDVSGTSRTASGTYVEYLRATTGTGVGVNAVELSANIDTCSVELVGWNDAQNLYDSIYAQTTGTAEQKTTAALRASAMWRHPYNLTDNALIYGKWYNKFAAKLIAEDIYEYNAINPDSLFEYAIPLRAELTTLSAIGGNAAKMSGTNYWTTANGTNISGFTALGSGDVSATGASLGAKSRMYLLCSDADFVREIKDGDDTFGELAITLQGGNIRLLKKKFELKTIDEAFLASNTYLTTVEGYLITEQFNRDNIIIEEN